MMGAGYRMVWVYQTFLHKLWICAGYMLKNTLPFAYFTMPTRPAHPSVGMCKCSGGSTWTASARNETVGDHETVGWLLCWHTENHVYQLHRTHSAEDSQVLEQSTLMFLWDHSHDSIINHDNDYRHRGPKCKLRAGVACTAHFCKFFRLVNWGLPFTIFHSTCLFVHILCIRYGTVLANIAVLSMHVIICLSVCGAPGELLLQHCIIQCCMCACCFTELR